MRDRAHQRFQEWSVSATEQLHRTDIKKILRTPGVAREELDAVAPTIQDPHGQSSPEASKEAAVNEAEVWEVVERAVATAAEESTAAKAAETRSEGPPSDQRYELPYPQNGTGLAPSAATGMDTGTEPPATPPATTSRRGHSSHNYDNEQSLSPMMSQLAFL